MSTIETPVAAVIDLALRAAIRAPSPHNTQPWRFEVGPGQVDLLLDRERVLAVADPVDGLTASFVTQPIEIPATRVALRELIGGRAHPQTALRLGYGYPAPQTPRRRVDAVTGVATESEEPRAEHPMTTVPSHQPIAVPGTRPT